MCEKTDLGKTEKSTINVLPKPPDEETAYLLGSPENAKHLLRSIAQLNAGKGKIRDLIE